MVKPFALLSRKVFTYIVYNVQFSLIRDQCLDRRWLTHTHMHIGSINNYSLLYTKGISRPSLETEQYLRVILYLYFTSKRNIAISMSHAHFSLIDSRFRTYRFANIISYTMVLGLESAFIV